jgi:hypothetical protein
MPPVPYDRETMKSISHTKSFPLDFPISKLFPLFSPEGEKLWMPGWDYKNVMGKTDLCEDYIFLTKTHDHGSSDAIWIVKAYNPESHFVQYYKIEPEYKVGVVTVQCAELGPAKTKVQVTYKYQALSKTGEEFIAGFSEEAYEEFIGEWQRLLTNYIQSKSPVP